MRLILTTEDGEVLNIWSEMEDWDLTKSPAQVDLCGEIEDEITKALNQGKR